MKLKKLTIHNIASIADAVIDFSDAPLASSDVFLICGETGAGKTTILDSICLALFGTVPRLQLGGKAVFDEIKYNDERQMLRSGCGEGYVSLSFTGNDSIDYESCWSVRRARNKVDGKFQNVLWTLKSSNLALSKTTEVRKAVGQALGIDYEQFVRTSMLAQGEFTRFLKAEDSEKAIILKKLTGTDRFTRIGAEIYRLTTEKQQAYESLRQRIAMEKILSAEEEAALREQYAGLEADEKAENDKLQQVNSRKTWLESLACLQKAIEASNAALEAAQNIAASPDIADKRLKIKFWRSTEPLRQALHNLKTARNERSDADDALKNLLPEFAGAIGALQTLTKLRDDVEADYSKAAAELIADNWRDTAFGRYEEIIAALNSLIDRKSDLSSDWIEYKKLQKILADSSTELKAASDDYDEKDATYKTAVDKLAEAEKLCATFDFKSLVAEQETARTRVVALEAFASLSETYAADLKALDRETETLSKAREELAAKENLLSEKKTTLSTKEEKYEQARLLFETLKFTASTAIATARAGLKTGCRCPVCMQTVEVLPPAEEIIKQQYDKAREDESAARSNLDKAKTDISSLEAQIAELRKSIADCETKVTNTRSSVDKSHESISAKVKELGINDDNTFEAAKKLAEEALVNAGKAISSAIAAQNAVDAARTERDSVLKNRQISEAAKNLCDKNLAEHKSKCEAFEERISCSIAECRKAGATFLTSDGIGVWKPGTPFDAKSFLARFIEEYGKRRALDKRIQSLEHRKGTLKTVVDECTALRDAIDDTMTEWKNIEPDNMPADNAKAIFTALSQKVTSQADRRVRADAAIMRHEADVRVLKDKLNDDEAEILPALQKLNTSDIEAYDLTCRNADEAVIKAEATLRQDSGRLAEHSERNPGIEENDSVESLEAQSRQLQDHIAQINRDKGDIIRRLQDNIEARNRQAELIAQADAAREVWVKWSRLNELIGSASGDKFNRVAQSFVLKALLDNANYYLSKLTDRYRLSGRDGQFIILVRDALNGNNERPVSTVSGGESFMASLALALALADAGTAFSSDILFIDEGFGTLSGEPLQRAVGMLRSLHSSSGKRVGIISHVEALRNEIPVQIRVSRNPAKAIGEICVTTPEA